MYHFRVKIHKRGKKQHKAVAASVAYRSGGKNMASVMAYRSGAKLKDPLTGKVYDFRGKARVDADGFGILHSEIMLPANAPPDYGREQTLINAIEAAEKRKDAQLMREAEISLPRELSVAEQLDLIRAFVQEQFVAKGMIAHVSIHDERASDGGRNPHAHVLLTMRDVTPDGFKGKNRTWNDPQLVHEWRKAWAEMANEKLIEAGYEGRLDHRSHAARDMELEAEPYVGPAAKTPFEGVIADARKQTRDAVMERNLAALELEPAKLLRMVSREFATFSRSDLARAAQRATGANDERIDALIEDVCALPDVQSIYRDQAGGERFATKGMIACEARMARAANVLARRRSGETTIERPQGLSTEQEAAFAFVMEGPDLRCVRGVAGAGKTTLLKSVAEAYRAQGRRVRGAALAGVAQKALADETGAPSATIASMFYAWDKGEDASLPTERQTLAADDVLIVDEAGMVASRDMERLLSAAADAGAKVILVGDEQQLQAIEAGAAFRALADTHGAASLKEVRRQRDDWMREATGMMAEGRIADALDAYAAAGRVHGAETTADARADLVASWYAEGGNDRASLMLANSVADVRALNDEARRRLRADNKLGPDVTVTIREQVRDEEGEIIQRAARRTFAAGDRILFRRNDKMLGVHNGSLGRVDAIASSGELSVRLDNGKNVDFAIRDYPDVELGYALTVHKAQGATVDQAYVLASRRFNQHLTYVALSRHRDGVRLFYGADQFRSEGALAQSCARKEMKDTTLHYLDAYLAAMRAQDEARDGGRTGEGAAKAAEVPTPPLAAESSNPQSIVRRNAARRRAMQLEKDRGREFER